MDLGKDGEQACDHGELLKAQAHVWSHIFSFIKSMALKCAFELGIPEIIHNHGQPMALPDLIAALPIHPTKAAHVRSLMRLLSHSGFFALRKLGHDQQGYVLTPSSRLLLKDNPFTMLPFVSFAVQPLSVTPSQFLAAWFQTDDPTANHTAYGMSGWDLMHKNPEVGGLFGEAMASDSRLVVSVVIDKCKEVFEGVDSLVDVGGGIGTMARAIALAFPELQCMVLDRPHVVDGCEGTNNLKFIGGDMFHTIPPAQVILLKWVLHNWGDEECVKILKNCKEAILASSDVKRGKVIIIDIVIEESNTDNEFMETQFFFDMQMMITANGKERNEKELAELFTNAGFSNYKINHILGLRSFIEVYL